MESNNQTQPLFDTLDSRRYLYVCEGITDEDKLKKLGCLFVVPTGGKYIRPEIAAFLKEAHQIRQIVLITDPDGPGLGIRKRIKDYVGDCLEINAEKQKAVANHKVGIAQMAMEDLKELLRPFVWHDIHCEENPSLEDGDFDDLGLTGKDSTPLRMKLVTKYSLPYTSAKKVEDYLMILAKTKKDLIEDLNDD
jgi:ribonuclease M5